MRAMILNPGRFSFRELEKVNIFKDPNHYRKTQLSEREQCHLLAALCTCNLQICQSNAMQFGIYWAPAQCSSIIMHPPGYSAISSFPLEAHSLEGTPEMYIKPFVLRWAVSDKVPVRLSTRCKAWSQG